MDQGKFNMLAQRVEEALSQESLFVEPKQIDPSVILVAPANRDGAPPYVRHVHYGILKSFMTKGFDRTRLAIGICIKYTFDHGTALVKDRNKRFAAKGNKLLPAINEEAMYGSLASYHYNLALRCIQAGLHSPIGTLSDLIAHNSNLKDVVLNGRRWWVPPKSLCPLGARWTSLCGAIWTRIRTK